MFAASKSTCRDILNTAGTIVFKNNTLLKDQHHLNFQSFVNLMYAWIPYLWGKLKMTCMRGFFRGCGGPFKKTKQINYWNRRTWSRSYICFTLITRWSRLLDLIRSAPCAFTKKYVISACVHGHRYKWQTPTLYNTSILISAHIWHDWVNY